MTYVRHHGLRDDGAAFSADGERLRDTVYGPGHALCNCGERSTEALSSRHDRQRWAAEHRAALDATWGKCRLCAALPTMTEERRDSMKRALASKMGAERISAILKANGYDIARWSIQKHRNEAHA